MVNTATSSHSTNRSHHTDLEALRNAEAELEAHRAAQAALENQRNQVPQAPLQQPIAPAVAQNPPNDQPLNPFLAQYPYPYMPYPPNFQFPNPLYD
ncbi:hypothetical protein CASFOL_009228 [Castilleja foliolosa]|uniref:Uncharacterized protein n=1 Tax=Castilleja foliolosa TaxID=1961234 RepID=A0ABD3E0M9_9LAMI